MSNKDDGGQYLAHLSEEQADALQEFMTTGRPSALGRYLTHEGVIDEGIRAAIIAILLGERTLDTAGGKDRWRDFVTFVRVGSLQIPNLDPSKNISKTAACRQYAEQTNQTLRTVELQYERGSKVFSPDSDVFTSERTAYEE